MHIRVSTKLNISLLCVNLNLKQNPPHRTALFLPSFLSCPIYTSTRAKPHTNPRTRRSLSAQQVICSATLTINHLDRKENQSLRLFSNSTSFRVLASLNLEFNQEVSNATSSPSPPRSRPVLRHSSNPILLISTPSHTSPPPLSPPSLPRPPLFHRAKTAATATAQSQFRLSIIQGPRREQDREDRSLLLVRCHRYAGDRGLDEVSLGEVWACSYGGRRGGRLIETGMSRW